MKPSARITVFSAMLALVCASQAQAARIIQTDDGVNFNWSTCGAECDFWNSSGYAAALSAYESMEISPLGADTSSATWYLQLNNDLDKNGKNKIGLRGTTHALPISGFYQAGEGDAQFLFSYSSDGDWTVQFSYPFDFLTAKYAFPTAGASFDWNGTLYTATQQDLIDHVTEVSDFTYSAAGGFTAPKWWTAPTTSVPEPGTIGLFAIGLGLSLVVRHRRKSSPLLQGA